MTDWPKRGFNVPIDDWLKGPLRGWVEDLIAPERLCEYGCFEPVAVRRLWEQHLCYWRYHANILWSILVFQAWFGGLTE